MLEYIAENWMQWSGWLFAFAAFLRDLYRQFNKKSARMLASMLRDFTLVDDTLKKVKGLDVSFKGTKVDNLLFSDFSIWNDGTEPILGDEISKSNPLRVATAEGESILEWEVLYTANRSNGIVITPMLDEASNECTALGIGFEYLDPKDGITIRIHHTGAQYSFLRLAGGVTGIKKFKRCYDSYYEYPVGGEDAGDSKKVGNRWVDTLVEIVLPLLFAIFLLYKAFFTDTGIEGSDTILIIFTVIFLAGGLAKFVDRRKNSSPSWVKKTPVKNRPVQVS